MRLSWTVPYLSPAVLLATALALTGQTAPGPAPGSVSGSSARGTEAWPQPTLRTSANLVLVDVVVTDRDQPVLGLDRSAFHVFEDGKELKITSFDQYQPEPAAPSGFMTAALPADTYTNLPEYPPSSAVNVLLLDALNTQSTDQMFVRKKMIDYLESIKPGTTLAVFTLSMQLRMVTPFTNDVGALARAVKSAKANPQVAAVRNTQQTDALDAAELKLQQDSPAAGLVVTSPSAAPVMGVAEALRQFQADRKAALIDDRMRITLDAMRELAGYLSGIQGRKNVIWFSGAFPLVMYPDSTLFSPYRNVTSYREEIQDTAEKLTAARVAIYPVDARGLNVPSEYNASVSFVQPDASDAKTMVKPLDTLSAKLTNEEEQWTDTQSTMQEVAKETGGRAYVDTNDLDKAVTDAVRNGSSYYTIAYAPPKEHLDGEYHKIQVRVDGERGFELAYRRGYYAEKPDASPASQDSASKQFVAALAHDAPPATQILVEARVVPASDPLLKGVSVPSPAPGQMTLKGTPHRYVIDLTLDAHSLTFNPNPDGSHQDALELAIVGYDANGQTVNLYLHPFQLGLKDALMQKIMTSGIPLRLAFDLPAGQVYLRIGVHDLNANRAGSLEVPLQVSAQ
jgi:VWFA-related protein